MAQCNKCGNQDLEWKEGTTKTGKNIGSPYKAWFCKPCKNMMFIPTPRKPNVPNPNYGQQPTTSLSNSNSLEKKVDKILAILEANFKHITVNAVHEESLSTDEEIPF